MFFSSTDYSIDGWRALSFRHTIHPVIHLQLLLLLDGSDYTTWIRLETDMQIGGRNYQVSGSERLPSAFVSISEKR